MARRVLDTSVLVHHWRRHPVPVRDRSEDQTRQWARDLLALHKAEGIVTPVEIEFLAGTASPQELQHARAYLAEMPLIDHGSVVDADWREARRLAQRVPADGRRRQLGDCLIRAIARRINCEVISFDESFPR